MKPRSCIAKNVEILKPDPEFINNFEAKVKKTICDYNMFEENDKILVAASGGKDSTIILYLLNKFGYNIEAITIDAHIGCYSEDNLKKLRNFCSKLGVNLHEISFRKEFGASLCYIRDKLNKKGQNLKSCTVCGVLRRYLINKKARELNATKIVFGHNLDDAAQSFLMNVLKNRLELSARTGPISGIKKEKGFVTRVKPLFFILEKDIVKYSKMKEFIVKYDRCPCATEGFRSFVRNFLNNYEKSIPNVKNNIVDYFMKRMDSLKSSLINQSPNVCILCEELSSRNICRSCKILSDFKNCSKSSK